MNFKENMLKAGSALSELQRINRDRGCRSVDSALERSEINYKQVDTLRSS